jgi:hypothetical protein
MALIKLSNNGVKNITSVGNVGTGDLVFISKQTASSSASISFTSGIDSTYKEYIFYFVNIHPSSNGAEFLFQGNAVGGSGFNETITSSAFEVFHFENGSSAGITYSTYFDKAQGTSFQSIAGNPGNGNDESYSGSLILYDPSSTTFVKHFMTNGNGYNNNDVSLQLVTAGYFNTTSAIDEIQFKVNTGTIESGDILLYGVN